MSTQLSTATLAPPQGELQTVALRPHSQDLPLERRLQQLGAYVIGLRRSQTESRARVRKVDESSVPVKISPLADWSKQDVEEYTSEHDLPGHSLYEKGYTSIGCAPCTRSIRPGEDERAVRWWWEEDSRNAECTSAGVESASGRGLMCR